MKRLNRLWSRRRSWSSPGPSWPPETPKVETPNMEIGKSYRQLEELVRYISCRVAQCLSRWVRENHRGNRDLQRVTGCLQTGEVLIYMRQKNDCKILVLQIEPNFQYYSVVACEITWTELWERSTIIPSRFISFITVCKIRNNDSNMIHKSRRRQYLQYKVRVKSILLNKHVKVTAQTSVFKGNRKFLHDLSQMELGH